MNEPANNRKPVYWTFDKKMYNGYEITDLQFAQANSNLNAQIAADYEISGTNPTNYGADILAVYLTMESGKYGSYKICRYIKMYNFPSENFEITIKQ